MEESSNLNAPPTPSMSDVDDGEEVVSALHSLLFCYKHLMLVGLKWWYMGVLYVWGIQEQIFQESLN